MRMRRVERGFQRSGQHFWHTTAQRRPERREKGGEDDER